MAESFIIHSKKGCRGPLFIDVAPFFSMKSPSLSVNPEQITVGAWEISRKSQKNIVPEFQCSKCGDYVKATDLDSIEIECSICHEHKEVSDLVSTYQIACICSGCKNFLQMEEKSPSKVPEYVRTIMRYVKFSRDEKFTPLVDLLQHISV